MGSRVGAKIVRESREEYPQISEIQISAAATASVISEIKCHTFLVLD